MTVLSEIDRSGPYTGNGVTSVFDYDFKILDKSHLRIVREQDGVETVLTVDTHYTVSGVGSASGGSVTMLSAPTADQQVTILRNIPMTQVVDFNNQGALFAATVERELDRAAMRDQQLAEQLSRALIFPAATDVDPAAYLQGKLDEINAALAAVSDVVSQGNVPIYATVVGMASTTVPDGIQAIRVNGYAATGDGGASLYKRVGTEPAHAGKMQSQDGAWWEIVAPEIYLPMISGTVKNLLELASGRPSVLPVGETPIASAQSLAGENNIRLSGQNRLASVLKRGDDVSSAVSFNNCDGVFLSDFKLDMRFSATSNPGHGVILLDCNDASVERVSISDLGNMGGSEGSGIIVYSSGSEIPLRNRVENCSVTGNIALSDNTNGVLLTDTRFSQMRGNFASGIAAFAHEIKNDARYCTVSDIIALGSGYALGYGQTTVGEDGVDYCAASNVIAAACDVGFTLGEGSYNALTNLIVNTDGAPGSIATKDVVRISGGARGNLITNVISVGTGTINPVRYDSSIRNFASIASHDSATNVVTNTGDSAKNVTEILHPGARTSIEDAIEDTTGHAIGGPEANPVYCIATGEFLGSLSGRFKWKLGSSGGTPSSGQNFIFESDATALLGLMVDDAASAAGVQINKGASVNYAGFIYTMNGDFWALRINNAAAMRIYANSLRAETDNSMALGTGAVRYSTVYAATGAINTSDEREKQDITDAREDEAAIRAIRKVKIKRFRWRGAVEDKGDGARLHFGVIAQEIKAAFESEGLDPFAYGLLCYDDWDDQYDDEGNVVRVAGNRYGVRMDELLALKMASLECE